MPLRGLSFIRPVWVKNIFEDTRPFCCSVLFVFRPKRSKVWQILHTLPIFFYYREVKHTYHFWLLLFGLLLGQTVAAQLMEEDTARQAPLFAAQKFSSRCFVGFDTRAGQILKNQAASQVAFSLNWVVNHRYVVTAKYHTLGSQKDISNIVVPYSTESIPLIHHYAGLGFGYLFFHDKRFSLHPELTMGWAAIKFKHPAEEFQRKNYAMIVPAVYGVWNATHLFRLGLGLDYQAAFGQRFFSFKSSYLNGVGGVVFIRVGTF